MAKKSYIETDRQVAGILDNVKAGRFKPIYLLMGEEPYYPDLVCNAILDNCLQEWEKDFNETVCYGADVTAEQVITAARRFPMMAERQLVVVKEAQAMKDIEELALYCDNPLDTTVLVILLHGAKVDERRAFYKSVLKRGEVVNSLSLRDYEVNQWIENYYRGRGLTIDPEAARLLTEHAGTDLGKIVVETDKMLKNLPEGTSEIHVADIEKNVGLSRQFSIFELTRNLSLRNAPAAVRVATYIARAPKFFLPPSLSALFLHFYRILKYEAALMKGPVDNAAKAKILGVNPYFFGEYDTAARNYPFPKCSRAISLIKEYDFKAKGGDAGEASPEELLVELVTKLLNI